MNAKSSDRHVDELNHWLPDQYELIDFGQGRKLERFGPYILDRPCPAATRTKVSAAANWQAADMRWADDGEAAASCELQTQRLGDWRVCFGPVHFQLRITPFGHVGLFPEHAAQWHWLLQCMPRLPSPAPSLLNLFAYTGGATLYLAGHGWQVTHVDSAEPTVQWARHNAQLSGMSQAQIRWLVEDARVYVARELKRGRRYDAILLDPPSYGHGPKGKAWQIQRDLLPLLEQCCQLLQPSGVIVLTGHSHPAPFTSDDLVAMRQACGHQNATADFARVAMFDQSKRALDFGWCLRSWPQA